MSGTESEGHVMLKRMAADWLRQQGFRIVAWEVRVPSSGYRADVAGYRRDRKGVGQTVVVECKQTRADFMRDTHDEQATRERIKRLRLRQQRLEELLRVHHPRLRKGETLFEEYDVIDFGALEHRGYRRVARELEVLQNRLFGGTKFARVARYRCANLLYVATSSGLVEEYEIPPGWGWLERDGEGLVLRRKPVWQDTPEANRLRLLEFVAMSGSVFRRRTGD